MVAIPTKILFHVFQFHLIVLLTVTAALLVDKYKFSVLAFSCSIRR